MLLFSYCDIFAIIDTISESSCPAGSSGDNGTSGASVGSTLACRLAFGRRGCRFTFARGRRLFFCRNRLGWAFIIRGGVVAAIALVVGHRVHTADTRREVMAAGGQQVGVGDDERRSLHVSPCVALQVGGIPVLHILQVHPQEVEIILAHPSWCCNSRGRGFLPRGDKRGIAPAA